MKDNRVLREVEESLEILYNSEEFGPGMILGAKFRSWSNFPWLFPKTYSLF